MCMFTVRHLLIKTKDSAHPVSKCPNKSCIVLIKPSDSNLSKVRKNKQLLLIDLNMLRKSRTPFHILMVPYWDK